MVFFDALRVKIRTDGVVANKAVYLALGVLPDGSRGVLGLWIEQTEGARFWLKVFNELKTRGCHDILIAVVDGLKGLAEAIGAVYPRTTVQTCVVHLIRASLEYASWKERQPLAAALRPIYTAPSAEAAAELLEAFAAGPWGVKYPTIAPAWRRAWEHVVPFLAFSPEIRRVIYTTNAIESLNMQLKKDHQDPRPLPKRRSSHQAALAGHQKRTGQDRSICLRLEKRDESVRHPVRRALHACSGLSTSSRSTASPTKRRTGPAIDETSASKDLKLLTRRVFWAKSLPSRRLRSKAEVSAHPPSAPPFPSKA